MKLLFAIAAAALSLGAGGYLYAQSAGSSRGSPIRVVLTDVENGQVTVSWKPVGHGAGPAITGYRVTTTTPEHSNDRVPLPRLITPPPKQVSASAPPSVTIGGLLEDCHQLYQIAVTPETRAGSAPTAESPVFRPSGIVVSGKPPPYVVVLLDGIGSQAAGFSMDPYHPTAIGPDSYCPQNINNGIPVPLTVGTGANKLPNNAFRAAPYGPRESFLKWNAWDPADNHGGNIPETDSNSTPRDLNPESPSFGKPTFSWMLDGIAATGAMILPYSYWGATLQGNPSAPRFVFNAYTDCNSTPAPYCTKDNTLDPGGMPDPAYHDYSNAEHSFSLSEDEDRLKTEIDSIEKVWRNEPIVIVGHSQGGLIAFETWRRHMLPGAVHRLFSLDSPINGVCAGQNLGVGCNNPPGSGYPVYAARYDQDPNYLAQDGGSDPAFRFIGTLGDEVRVLPRTPASTPSYGTGIDTLQVQLLVTGPNCTGTDRADCPSRVDHVSECQLPEQPWVLNRVTPVVNDQNRWIYDTGHFVVKFCPGNVNYFNTVLGLSLDQLGPRPVAPKTSTFVMCFNAKPVPEQTPASCAIFGEPEIEANLIILSNMHWTNWGQGTAVGSGVEEPTHPGQPGETSTPVTIALSDPAPRCHGQLFYTKLVVVHSGQPHQFQPGDGTLRLSGACSPASATNTQSSSSATTTQTATSTATTAPTTPGYDTPEDAVDGFYSNELSGSWSAVCSYLAPSAQAVCLAGTNGQGAATGGVQIGRAVISGTQALVPVTGNLCGPTSSCVTNTDPSTGMPPSSQDFSNSYQNALSNATSSSTTVLSPMPCIEIGGKWYVAFG